MRAVILVGLQGSGKTTLATNEFKDYVRISQDDLGSREAALKLFSDSLHAGKPCIVDRCNHNEKQRSEWIRIANLNNARVDAIYIEADVDFCAKRMVSRENHPTIKDMTLDKCKRIVNRTKSELTVPTLEEGFQTVLLMRAKS